MTFDPKEARALVKRLDGYTPKQWHLGPDDEGDPAVCVTSDGFDICTAWGGYNRAEADAAIIAAAPDLHRHLTAALEENERLRDALQEGVDLIESEAVGADWKRGCRVFIGHAREALKGANQ